MKNFNVLIQKALRKNKKIDFCVMNRSIASTRHDDYTY